MGKVSETNIKNRPAPIQPEELFQKIADQKGACWLDSSMRIADKGKHSIIAWNPVAEISCDGNNTTIDNYSEKYKISKNGNIFDIIEHLVKKEKLTAIGYISYEATLSFLELPYSYSSQLPQIRFLLYDDVLKYDHQKNRFNNPLPKHLFPAKNNLNILPRPIKPFPELKHQIDKKAYFKCINRIKDFIKEGDIYQANYTSRFELISKINPFLLYKNLRRLNPAPYAAYLNFGDSHILSSSPERMFTVKKNQICSCPIKGTISVGENETERNLNLKKLVSSEKDKAELLMIVDLVRNDLGKIARYGSVKVDSLFQPEAYSSLIHLVSDISAVLKEEVSLKEILHALLPGGSITGAPKKRAVEIITQLESLPRSVYTGCIGYISEDSIDFNIAIRTMYQSNGSYFIHAGGGIVADSDPETEYNEMLLKAKNLFRAIGWHND